MYQISKWKIEALHLKKQKLLKFLVLCQGVWGGCGAVLARPYTL